MVENNTRPPYESPEWEVVTIEEDLAAGISEIKYHRQGNDPFFWYRWKCALGHHHYFYRKWNGLGKDSEGWFQITRDRLRLAIKNIENNENNERAKSGKA